MSDKGTKKNTTKNNKRASKNRKIPAFRLDNNDEVSTKTTYIKDTECIRITDKDVDKIRVPDKKLYKKHHNSYMY